MTAITAGGARDIHIFGWTNKAIDRLPVDRSPG
jgi:hypothetical protein